VSHPEQPPQNYARTLKYEAVARLTLERALEPDFRQILQWLEAEGLPDCGPAEWLPPMDVLETTTGIEIVADVPGLEPSALRVIITKGVVVIAGHKRPVGCAHQKATFHLAERSFGRFARLFQLAGAFAAGQARATFRSGVLHVVVPRIEERRGAEIHVPVSVD
jgi:HSP20 family protein